jgi:hypothetical protein
VLLTAVTVVLAVLPTDVMTVHYAVSVEIAGVCGDAGV